MTTYKPQPLDTTEVNIPSTLVPLMEDLARNTHEVWAQERISQGWSYGANRDDDKRLHPCLKPYEELPEGEKEFDRKTAAEVLKAILTLGFTIEKADN